MTNSLKEQLRGIKKRVEKQPKWLQDYMREYFKEDGKHYEMYNGEMREVVNPERTGYWRFHTRDRNGYCDNPARGY